MQDFKPFNYGNVLAMGENIKGARLQNTMRRQQLDPNSPQNQLMQEQLNGARQGNVLAQQQGQRQQTQFDQQQKVEKLKMLNMAAAESLQNPQALSKWIPELQNIGELPQILQQIYDGTSAALGIKQKNIESYGDFEQIPGASEGTLGQKDLSSGKYINIQTKKSPLVNIDQTQEKEESKEWGKSLVANFDDVAKRAQGAEDSLANLQIASSIDVSTGAFEPSKAWASSIAQGLGFNPEIIGLDKADNAQAYQGIVQNLVLTKMQAQKGPQTENDAKRIELTIAQLGNTPEAKRFLLDSSIALEERKIEERDFYLDYKSKNKSLDGARSAWNKYKAKTPLLGDNPKTGRPVFYNQFKRGMLEANPGVTVDQINTMWRSKYGR